jgi:hypothetical protein
MKIRQLTTGPKAKISHICPKSEQVVNDIEVDISTFPVVKYEGSINKVIDLTPTIQLVLGPVTRKTEKDIEKWLKMNGTKDSMVDKRYCAYAGVVKGVKYKTDLSSEKYEDVEGMSFDDKLKFLTEYCRQEHLMIIDDFMKTLDFGIKPEFRFKSDVYENDKEEASLLSFFIM